MPHFILSTAFTTLASFLLAILVISRDRRNTLHRIFSLYCLSVAGWSFFLLMSVCSSDPLRALYAARTLHFFAAFTPVLFLHFVDVFLGRSKTGMHRGLLRTAYGAALLMIALSFTPGLVHGVAPKFGLGFYSEPGADYWLYVGYWVLCATYGLSRLVMRYYHTDPVQRNQLQYLFTASFIGFIGGVDNFLRVYDRSLFPSYAFGNYLVALYVFITAYAIMTRQLLDITVAIRRAAVFTGIFAFIYAALATAIIRGFDFFKTTLQWDPLFSAFPAALAITVAFRPLEAFLTRATDRFLFQQKYDYRALLKTLTSDILSVLEIQELADRTIDGFVRIVRLRSAALFLWEEAAQRYAMTSAVGVAGYFFVLEDTPLIRQLAGSHEAAYHRQMQRGDPKFALDADFQALGAEIYLPIVFRSRLVGFLALGPKLSEEEYTKEDLDILTAVSGTLGVAVSNARFFSDLSKLQAEAAQREKMAVIGTLAAGINHEICNPLGIARGQCELFLMDLKEGLHGSKTPEAMSRIFSEIAQKVISDIDRAVDITRRLADFSKPSKQPHLEKVSVSQETDEVLALLRHELEVRDVRFKKSLPAGFPDIHTNRRQFQEVLFNLILNAAQAADKRPETIELTGVVRGGKAVLEISDNGTGIPPEKLKQIFNPFYTTKSPGHGTGLGLFIVKQIVEKNGGTIEVESTIGTGTIFQITFLLA